MKKILLFSVLICFAGTLTAGGGWTYEKGKGFVKLSQSAIYADKYFSPDGSTVDITTIGYYATSLYGEYGITDRLTAIAYVPFFSRNTLNIIKYEFSGIEIPGDELNSFGDMDLSLQYGLIKSDTWVMSARVLFGLPTGDPQGGETGILQTGDGEFNQMLRLDLSRGFAKNYWASAYSGFNNRTEGFSDEFRWGAEVGASFKGRYFIIAKVDAVHSFENGTVDPSQTGTLFSNNMEYISPSLELAAQNEQGWGISISAAGALAGQNVLAAPNFTAGIFRKF